jgi:hypothetical protein
MMPSWWRWSGATPKNVTTADGAAGACRADAHAYPSPASAERHGFPWSRVKSRRSAREYGLVGAPAVA